MITGKLLGVFLCAITVAQVFGPNPNTNCRPTQPGTIEMTWADSGDPVDAQVYSLNATVECCDEIIIEYRANQWAGSSMRVVRTCLVNGSFGPPSLPEPVVGVLPHGGRFTFVFDQVCDTTCRYTIQAVNPTTLVTTDVWEFSINCTDQECP